MAENIFEKWNKEIDVKGLQEDIQKASQGKTGNYVDVPVGEYEVKLAKAEVKATKNGDPMATLWFKVLAGEYEGQTIFFNQVITQGFQIHIVDDFLKSLDTGLDIHFEDYAQYNDLLLDVVEACDGKLEFALEYGVNNKGFNTYKITDIFEVA